MSVLDVVIAVAAVLAVVGGYRLGLVTRVLSWVGLAVGLVVGVRLLPLLLDRLDTSAHTTILLLTVGFLLVAASLGQALGFLVGGRLRPRAATGTLSTADRVLGAGAGLVGVVVLVWLVTPVLVATPGWLARQATNSWVVRTVDEALPPPPDAMQTLQAIIGDDAFPEVFDALRPTPDLGPPPAATGLTAIVADQVAASVLKVEGEACGRIQDGTGFVAAPGLVVTNAHVVAGESGTEVIRDDGARLDATLVAFDPERDLAVLAVDGLDRAPLPLGPDGTATDTTGGVFGHPGGEPLRIAPFRVARRLAATGRDIYGSGTTEREVLELSAALRPGDSGSALVGADGQVVGVAFAIARDRSDVAYALDPSEVRPVLESVTGAPVGAGSCLA